MSQCIERASSQISSTHYEVMDKGRDYESHEKACRYQTDLGNTRRNEATEAYTAYGFAMKAAEDAAKDYNAADKSFFNFILSACKDYAVCVQNKTKIHDETCSGVAAREAAISKSFNLASELSCMLQKFIDSDKVDMSLTSECKSSIPTKLPISYPDVESVKTCAKHSMEVVALPVAMDPILADESPCAKEDNPLVTMRFMKKPSCPGWCQPLSGHPTVATNMPTITVPTSSPTKSVAQKLADKALAMRQAAEAAAARAAEQAKILARSMATNLKMF